MKTCKKIVIILAFLLGLTRPAAAGTADSTWYDEMWVLAEKLLYERIEENNKLISEGRADETDYIIDMYAAIIGRGKDFVDATAKAALQQKLRNVYLEGDATKEKVNPYVIIGLPAFKVEVHVDPNEEAVLHKRRDKIFKLRDSYQETLTATLVLNGLIDDKVNAQGQVEVYAAHYTLAAASRWLDAKLNISLYSVWNSQRQAYGLVTALPSDFSEGTLPPQSDRATYLNQEVDHFIGLLQRKPTAAPRDPFAVTCDMDIAALKELTQANRQRDYAGVASRFSTVANSANYVKQCIYIKADTLRSFMHEDVFSGEVLPDKFKALEGNSEYRMHLVYTEVSFALNNAEWSTVAQQVHQASGLSPKDILIIVPYFRTEAQCGSFSRLLAMRVYERVAIVMPAAYCPDGALMGQINAELVAASEWETRLKNSYKHIPKKRVVYAYSFLWNGDFIKHEKKIINKYEAGHENVYELLINDDERYEQLQDAERELNIMLSALDEAAKEGGGEYYEELLSNLNVSSINNYFSKVEAIMSTEDLIRIKKADDITQSILSSETNADVYAHWLWRRKTGSSIAANLGWTGEVPADEWFYGEVNTASAADFLIVIDAASFVASFVGLDVVFDTWGFYYALDKGLTTEATIYATAATIGVVTGGELRLVMAGLRRAELAVVKTLYNSSISLAPLSGKMYCAFFPIVIRTNLAAVISKALASKITSKETFLRLISYGKKADYKPLVATFEEAMESASFRQLVNDDPKTISVFFEYMKTKPSATVQEVLNMRLLTAPVPANQLKQFMTHMSDPAFNAVIRRPGMVDTWVRLKNTRVQSEPRWLAFVNDSKIGEGGIPASWRFVDEGEVTKVYGGNGKLFAEYDGTTVSCTGGDKGKGWNTFLNAEPPLADITYNVDGYLYKTDDMGRVMEVSGDLTATVRGRLNSQQIRSVDIKDGLPGDQGGHAIAARFYGPGEQINYYPQSGNINQGAWKKMENDWAVAMTDEFDDAGNLIKRGESVRVQIVPEFVGNSKRPDKFVVTYQIGSGRPVRLEFKNL